MFDLCVGRMRRIVSSRPQTGPICSKRFSFRQKTKTFEYNNTLMIRRVVQIVSTFFVNNVIYHHFSQVYMDAQSQKAFLSLHTCHISSVDTITLPLESRQLLSIKIHIPRVATLQDYSSGFSIPARPMSDWHINNVLRSRDRCLNEPRYIDFF